MMVRFQTAYLFCFFLRTTQTAIFNVALNRTSQQSSTDYQWIASRANDGDKRNLEDMNHNSCSHTNSSGYYTAWWEVELEKAYSISHVILTTRDWIGGPGRLAGFSIYVSDASFTGSPSSQHLCFHDSIPKEHAANERRINCTHIITGRYVVIYNKRPLTDPVADFQYSNQSILELCEVNVPIEFANCGNNLCTSCKVGWYGERCESSCANCGGTQGCWKYNGHCYDSSCKAGYYGDTCTDMCLGTTCFDNRCDFRTGLCQKCGINFYGQFCNRSCSNNCAGDGSCNFQSGDCNECQDGRHGHSCEHKCPVSCKTCKDNWSCDSCKEGFYGKVCEHACPGCGGNSSCLKWNGRCTHPDCKPKYYGTERCNQNCSSNCAPDGSCEISSGICSYGCINRSYGQTCSEPCPGNCGGDGSCQRESGVCSRGCKTGWNGIRCNSECAFPKFGQNCSQDCGRCKSDSCHHMNGTCLLGCEDGWSTPKCNIRASEIVDDPSSSGVSTGLLGGVVGAVVLVIVVVIIVIVVIKRSRTTNKGSRSSSNNGYMSSPETVPAVTQNAMYTNIMSVEEEKRASKPEILTPKPVASQSKPPKNADDSNRTYYNSVDIKKEVAVSELKAYVTEKLSTNKYEEEFQAIPYGAIHPTTVAETPKNIKKNRFKTTFPYDHSRVILKGKSDYINANFIEDTNGVKKYIATQGPIPNTIEDFWQMVWEYNIDIIVMLTNLQEGKKRKCEQYWPKPNEKVTHGQFGLSLLDERHFSYYSLRELEVLEAKTKQSRKILQYHFTTWPDHGTPDPLFLVLFHKRVISKAPKYDGPILVHCSAGIGRTGTFIALDALESQGNNTGAVDIENYVRIMRKDRMNMIQTSEQYKVLHEALVEAFQWQDTYISMDDFSSVWQSIETDKRPLNQQRLKKEYDMLREMRGDSENPVSAAKEENKAKNRTDSILPLDKHRPYLSSYFAGGNDFINSVIIPSHLAKDGFMVTQVPLQGTIVDFWRLITDHDSRCIVYFAQSSDEETNFYPSHEDVTDTEMHNVKKESSNTLQEGVEEVKMKVKGKKSNQTKDVTLLKIDMAGKNYPTGAQIFRAVEIVELQRNRNKNSPCTVVSLDGGTPCEVFCAISNILEYMKVDNRIDVFQTARQLQIRRPEFFETFETYRYCYQMINEYLMTQSVYFNM